MALVYRTDAAQNLEPTLPWLNEARRRAVELLVSDYRRERWRIRTVKDLKDLASHPCAILADGAYAVFVKLSSAANGLDQFDVEVAGLRLLSARAGVLTPPPIGLLTVDDSVLMVLAAVTAVNRGPQQWRDIGRTLARIHQIKGPYCGLETQGYFGALYQDNRPLADWPTFFAERRLWPRLMSAIDSGHLSTTLIRQVEKLIERLPDLCGPAIVPTLLHGDAQQNNFISTDQGAVVIDPAVHYGHPEIDLAHLDYFHAVPDDLFAGYQEVLPIDAGFWERRALWCIPTDLAIVGIDEPGYLGKLTAAVQKYV